MTKVRPLQQDTSPTVTKGGSLHYARPRRRQSTRRNGALRDWLLVFAGGAALVAAVVLGGMVAESLDDSFTLAAGLVVFVGAAWALWRWS